MYGGVGPLHSDVTLAGVAKAFGVRLVSYACLQCFFFIMIITLILLFCQMFLVFWVCCTNLTVSLDILVFLMKKFQTTQTFLTDFLVWSEELKDVCYMLTNCILLG